MSSFFHVQDLIKALSIGAAEGLIDYDHIPEELQGTNMPFDIERNNIVKHTCKGLFALDNNGMFFSVVMCEQLHSSFS